MRYRWLLSSVAIGIIVLLLVYYMFSLAFAINARENSMINKLVSYRDTTVGSSHGLGDEIWLAAVGSLITLFAGGMAATVLSQLDKASGYKLLVTAAVVAIFTVIAISAFIYMAWDRSMQIYQAGGAQYGPTEPMPFILSLFLMLVLDGVCYMASAVGGLVAIASKASKD